MEATLNPKENDRLCTAKHLTLNTYIFPNAPH